MTIKNISCSIISFLIICNVAKANLKQVELERAANDKQITAFIKQQGIELREAKSQLVNVNTTLIPILQKQLNVLQSDEVKYLAMSAKYTKLKTAFVTIGSLFVGSLVLLVLLKFNVLLPYGWMSIPICMAATTTFLVWKL